MKILVTGGAGYIGSCTVEYLRGQGEQVVVLDNLSRGHRQAVGDTPLYVGDVGDEKIIERITREHDITACIHFAAFAYVGESVTDPASYYENNTAQTKRLLDALLKHNVRDIVFSSTCATYGEPQRLPLDETHPQFPQSPYGWSKLFVEKILESYASAYGLRYAALRYFNACGAMPNIGEDHEPETHLIPLVLFAAQQRIPHIAVFGDDYPTPDGTCVRDYIHVADLASAHLLALKHLQAKGTCEAINLGNGQGYSVLEVIETARRITGRDIRVEMQPRRPGDPSHLVADATKARTLLGWNAAYPELETIIETAWQWHEAHPNGYED